MTVFEISAFLIGLSALFGYLNHQFLRVPHTIGLVLMALAASVTVILIDLVVPDAHIGRLVTDILDQIDFHEALMHGMLSFLLFAGALHVEFSVFRSRLRAIGVLATLGTMISTFAVGTGVWLLFDLFDVDLPFIWALVFGALISPTDPVAVLGLFKSVKVPDTLQAKMAGESLFNDGVGVVVFTVVVSIAVASSTDAGALGVGDVAELFFTEVFGGALLGLVAGYLGYRAMYHIDEHNLEVLITLAVVMVGYALAIRLHMSGPIAMVIAGLFIGDKGMKYAVSDNTRDHLQKFWSLLDEILNSALFLLIGLEVLVIARADTPVALALLAIPLTLAARWLSIYIPISLLSRWDSFTKGAVPVLVWGGLRGGIAVALALSLPENEYKDTILTLTYAAVLFSIVVQGLSIKALVSRVIT
ncbi:MAG: sodium:proton antiporter [Gammaproteobacteria bacterium]